MSGFIVLQCFTFVPSVSEFFTLLSWFHTESISDTDTDSTLDDEFCGAQGRRSSATGCSSSVVLKFWSPWRLKRWHFLWSPSRDTPFETWRRARPNPVVSDKHHICWELVSFKAHISLLRFIPCEFHGCYGYLWLLGVLGSST